MNVKPMASLVTAICVFKKLPCSREAVVGGGSIGVTADGGKRRGLFEVYSCPAQPFTSGAEQFLLQMNLGFIWSLDCFRA